MVFVVEKSIAIGIVISVLSSRFLGVSAHGVYTGCDRKLYRKEQKIISSKNTE